MSEKYITRNQSIVKPLGGGRLGSIKLSPGIQIAPQVGLAAVGLAALTTSSSLVGVIQTQNIIATTHIDAQNERITPEALEKAAELVNSGNKPSLLLDHDITIPPYGKMLSAKVEKREDGEYQLITPIIRTTPRNLTLDWQNTGST
ncbi:MAG: hypothetical protein Q7O66_17965 [Dehalococcoidia bacterium]|nr:hypothetical protein [Dehalococcoidia bacterium]